MEDMFLVFMWGVVGVHVVGWRGGRVSCGVGGGVGSGGIGDGGGGGTGAPEHVGLFSMPWLKEGLTFA